MMHRPSMIAGVLLTGGVLYALLTWAHAALVELHWLNPSETETATRVLVGPTALEYPADCGPGETCETVVDLPSGPNEVWIHQGTDDEWSSQSNVEIYTAAPPEGCYWDFDGSGTVTSLDFGVFLAGFGTTYNAADFGAFLRVFGTECA